MKQQAHERALRALAAALLDSGLSAQEIREVTASLTTDGAFGERLVRLVDAIAEGLAGSVAVVEKPAPVEKAGSAPDAEGFLRILAGIDVTNKALADTLQRHAARPEWSPNPRMSRRRMVEEFLRVAPREAAGKALDELTRGAVEPDPYFDQIMRRRRKVG